MDKRKPSEEIYAEFLKLEKQLRLINLILLRKIIHKTNLKIKIKKLSPAQYKKEIGYKT